MRNLRHWQRFKPTEPPGKDKVLSHLQGVHCAPGFQLLVNGLPCRWLSSHLRVFSAPVRNPVRTHGSFTIHLEMDVGGTPPFVCLGSIDSCPCLPRNSPEERTQGWLPWHPSEEGHQETGVAEYDVSTGRTCIVETAVRRTWAQDLALAWRLWNKVRLCRSWHWKEGPEAVLLKRWQ